MRLCLLVFASTVALAGACGARTDLVASGAISSGGGGSLPVDVDGGDASPIPDAAADAIDAPPPLCEGAVPPYIHVITNYNDMLRFDVSSKTFEATGHLDCVPNLGVSALAVDAAGKTAYAALGGGKLIRIDTATAACELTSFESSPLGFDSFLISFAANTSGSGETLYFASVSFPPTNAKSQLGVLDPATLQLTLVGGFSKNLFAPILAGRGDARLFAWNNPGNKPGNGTFSGQLVEIAPKTAEVLSVLPLDSVVNGAYVLTMAAWGSSFYFFTLSAQDINGTDVVEYQPATGKSSIVATLNLQMKPTTITAAGASVCASTMSTAGARIVSGPGAGR